MSDLISEVLAELRELIGVVDSAATLALRAQIDAQEAFAAYREASDGSKRPRTSSRHRSTPVRRLRRRARWRGCLPRRPAPSSTTST